MVRYTLDVLPSGGEMRMRLQLSLLCLKSHIPQEQCPWGVVSRLARPIILLVLVSSLSLAYQPRTHHTRQQPSLNMCLQVQEGLWGRRLQVGDQSYQLWLVLLAH